MYYPRHIIAVVATLLLLPLSAIPPAQAEKMASLMPLASRSLLLDLALAGPRIVVAGEHGDILFSDDNANTWTQARVPTTQMLTGVHFANAKKGWAVGHDGLILASDDGGENWRLQLDGLSVKHQSDLELRERSYQHIQSLNAALETAPEEEQAELQMQLEDAQLDLEDAELLLKEPVHTPPFMDIWFENERHGWAVGAFGTFFSTQDGGQHWSRQVALLDNPNEFHLNAITGDGKGRVFIAGEGGIMFRSLDNGLSWQSIEPVYEGSLFGAIYDAEHDALVICGLQGKLFVSRDFGTTWEAVNSGGTITLAGGTANKGTIIVVGGVGTVLSSKDGGTSFRRTMIEDRLSLSSGMSYKNKLVLIGQGGVKVRGTGN